MEIIESLMKEDAPDYPDKIKNTITQLNRDLKQVELTLNVEVRGSPDDSEIQIKAKAGSVFIQGKTKLETREEEYQEVATEQYKVIIATYGVAAVGINLPRIFNLVLVEPGKSFVRVIQSIGRGIRKAEDKDYVQIWDITSSCKYSKRHLTARKRFYKEAKYPYTVSKVKI